MKVPIKAANHLVLSRDTITIDEEDRGDGVLGRYGIGYGFIKDSGTPGHARLRPRPSSSRLCS